MFKGFDELINAGGTGDAVYLWPKEIDYKNPNLEETSLAGLFGLPDSGIEGQKSEFELSHLFGATVLHVVFVGGKDEKQKREGLECQTSLSGIHGIINWVSRLEAATKERFSEEQSRSLRRHVLVLVSSDGLIRSNTREIGLFTKWLSDGSCLRACFFLDYNLEIGNIVGEKKPAIFSRYVWPIMIGRLILRFLIDPPKDDDELLKRGIHLWRTKEFRLKYPNELLDRVWNQRLEEAYTALSDGDGDAKSDGAANDGRESKILEGFGRTPELTLPKFPEQLVGWESMDAGAFAQEMVSEDRWRASKKQYRADFKGLVLQKRGDLSPDSQRIFSSVSSSPRNVFHHLNFLDGNRADTSLLSQDAVFDKWNKMVLLEHCRQGSIDVFLDDSKEYDAMRRCRIPWYVGLVAAFVVSIFCVAAIVQIAHRAMGCGMFTSLWLGGFSIIGAAAAWMLMSVAHSHAGQQGQNSLLSMGRAIDEMAQKRSGVAFDLINDAQKCRNVENRSRKNAFVSRMLGRIARFLKMEVKSPVINVFFEESKADAPPDEDVICSDQKSRFLSVTVSEADCDSRGFTPEKSKGTKGIVDAAFGGGGAFFEHWKKWCSELGGRVLHGDFPAGFFIPRIRSYMRRAGVDITGELKADFQKACKIDLASMLKDHFDNPSHIKEWSGHTSASMHVDSGNIKNEGTSAILFVQPGLRVHLNGMRIRPIVNANVLAETSLYAFYFQDMHVDFMWSENDDKLVLKDQPKANKGR